LYLLSKALKICTIGKPFVSGTKRGQTPPGFEFFEISPMFFKYEQGLTVQLFSGGVEWGKNFVPVKPVEKK
jgi:hypothetical protein